MSAGQGVVENKYFLLPIDPRISMLCCLDILTLRVHRDKNHCDEYFLTPKITVARDSYRKISRLPLSVFQDLITRPPVENRDDNPESLKANICKRLEGFRVRVRNSARDRNRNKNNGGGGSGISLSATTISSIRTIGQLLRLSKYSLMLALDPILTYEEVGIFLNRVCKQCAPESRSVLKLYRATTANTNANANANTDLNAIPRDADPVAFGSRMRHLPTSLPSLDRILHGGVRLTTVTELVGRSGVGKTQLAFQLCVTAAKFNQGAIYIDTEKKMSLERLGEPSTSEELLEVLDALEYEILIRNQTAGQAFLESGAESAGTTTNATSTHTHTHTHTHNKTAVRGKYPVRLLIVDSIAAPMRRDFGTDSAPQRAAAIFQCAQKLKRLADQLHLAVVVINQVGAAGGGGVGVGDGRAGNGIGIGTNAPGMSSEQQRIPVRAALGTSWHHCVSTRLLLETSTVGVVPTAPELSGFDNGNGNGSHNDSISRQTTTLPTHRVTKKIVVVKSNRTALGETRFAITSTGIVED
eukprot:jgi/Psemu1/325273/estExt_fgenesh1_pg.C_2200006